MNELQNSIKKFKACKVLNILLIPFMVIALIGMIIYRIAIDSIGIFVGTTSSTAA